MRIICFILGLLAGSGMAYANNQTASSTDKPMRFYLNQYHEDDGGSTHEEYVSTNEDRLCYGITVTSDWESHNSLDWIEGIGGGGVNHFYVAWDKAIGDQYGNLDCDGWEYWIRHDDIVCPPYANQLNIPGAEYSGYSDEEWLWFGVTNGGSWASTWNQTPPMAWQHCQVSLEVAPDKGYPDFWWFPSGQGNYHRTADAFLTLETGGKAKSARKQIYHFSATANEITNHYAGDPDWEYYHERTRALAATNITIGTLPSGSDGTVWAALEDGRTLDVTPRVKNVDYYIFNEGPPEKYHPTITLQTGTNNFNLDTITPEICVGQQATFSLSGLPGCQSTNDIWWHLPDKFVNQTNKYSATCTNYIKNPDLLTNATTRCWYYNQPGGNCSVRQTLHFDNGQSVNIAAAGSFTVYRPTITVETLTIAQQNHYYTINNDIGTTCKLKLGEDDGSGNGTMNFTINCWSKYSGQFGITQLITANYSNPLYIFSVERCDGSEYYADLSVVIPRSRTNIITGAQFPNAFITLDDGPNSIWLSPNIVNLSVRDFARFQPDGGIPVTLGIVTWETVGTAERTFLGDDWNITTDSTTGPNGPDHSDEFPIWKKHQGGMH
jgi:hypothetical protein